MKVKKKIFMTFLSIAVFAAYSVMPVVASERIVEKDIVKVSDMDNVDSSLSKDTIKASNMDNSDSSLSMDKDQRFFDLEIMVSGRKINDKHDAKTLRGEVKDLSNVSSEDGHKVIESMAVDKKGKAVKNVKIRETEKGYMIIISESDKYRADNNFELLVDEKSKEGVKITKKEDWKANFADLKKRNKKGDYINYILRFTAETNKEPESKVVDKDKDKGTKKDQRHLKAKTNKKPMVFEALCKNEVYKVDLTRSIAKLEKERLEAYETELESDQDKDVLAPLHIGKKGPEKTPQVIEVKKSNKKRDVVREDVENIPEEEQNVGKDDDLGKPVEPDLMIPQTGGPEEEYYEGYEIPQTGDNNSPVAAAATLLIVGSIATVLMVARKRNI